MVVVMGPQGWVQRQVGLALRRRVAGESAAEQAQEIWGSPGPRWFSPEDPIWRVHADAAMFPGGVAALLLQSLHPQAMAGVAGHSGYQGDPWGRLQRTSRYIATTTFGTVPAAESAIARVRSIHARVTGVDDLGLSYAASDPHLLRWVHVAEIVSFLAAYQAFSQRPLTAAEADQYVAQSAVAASRLGAQDLPSSTNQLAEVITGYRAELRLTTAARQAASLLLVRPPLPPAARGGYYLLAAGGVAVLPTWARDMLQLPSLPGSGAITHRLGRAGTGFVRWGMAGVEGHRGQAPANAETVHQE